MIDILMITYDRPGYVALALPRLLETCDDSMRVWVWHNGEHRETLDMVRSFISHPRIHRFHHSPENVGLTAPTNWMWESSDGEFLSKVDDDCLLEPGWAQTLVDAHRAHQAFGVLGCWRFPDEDFIPELAHRKIRQFPGGHYILQNFWVQGSGYLMKRRCLVEQGLLSGPGQSFTSYCIALALRGYVHGWYYPFLREEHLDDPRSSRSALKSDEDLLRRLPLSAARTGVRSLGEWQAQLKETARSVQAASIDPRDYRGWRRRVRRARQLAQRTGQ